MPTAPIEYKSSVPNERSGERTAGHRRIRRTGRMACIAFETPDFRGDYRRALQEAVFKRREPVLVAVCAQCPIAGCTNAPRTPRISCSGVRTTVTASRRHGGILGSEGM